MASFRMPVLPTLFRLFGLLSFVGHTHAFYEVVDFQAPGPKNLPKNTTLIGLYSLIRSMGSARAQDNSILMWCLPFVAKSALIAWRDGLLLEPPAKRANTDFDLLFLDECRSVDECSSGRTLNLATRMMLGDKYRGQEFPAVKAMVGGYFYTAAVSKQAEAMRIPNVGFAAQSEDFSDKAQYPMFMRTCGSTAQGKIAIASVLKELAFTKALLWMCNNADAAADRDVFLTTVGPQIGITLTALIMPRSSITGCLPQDPAVYSQWEGNLKAAKQSGVHAHIGWWSMQCPTYDIMHWLAHEGLVSRGHFWISGDAYLATLYRFSYYPLVQVQMCPVGAPAEQQTLTPFASERGLLAFDGYTILQSQVDETNFKKWFSWMQTLKPRQMELFEPWYNTRITEAAWQSTTDTFWRQPWTRFLFDAIWMVLRNVNAMMLEGDTDIDGPALLARMRNDSFDGLSGRIEFDSRGERVGPQNIAQWRHHCPGERRLTARENELDEQLSEQPYGHQYESVREQLQLMADLQARSPLRRAAAGAGAGAANSTNAAASSPGISGTGAVKATAVPGYVWIGTFRSKLELTKPMLFFGCTSQVPPDSDLPCDPGSFYDADAASCQRCPRGTASSLRGQSFCSACPGGMFGASEGQSVCQACTSGKFSLDGATNCTSCAAGTYTADVQQTQCLACAAGKYAAGTGTTDCPRCAAGSYQSRGGQSTCELCPLNQITLYPGSSSASECTCAPGWYWASGTCRQCDETFPGSTVLCAGDRAPPTVKEGFMTLKGDLEVFLCRSAAACPGGMAVGEEQCAAGGSGVACALCAEEHRYDMRQGSCVRCSKAAVAVFWSMVVLGFFALAVKLRSTEVEYGVRSLTSTIKAIFVAVPLSQCGDLLQFQSVLGKSSVHWPQEVGPTFAWLSGIMEFRDFSVECFLGADKSSYPIRYVVLANLLPLFMLASCFLLALPALLNKGVRAWRFPDPLRAASAALGVMLALFLTVLNWALNLVFSTYQHPDHSLRSLQSFPHVLTTDPGMVTLQAVSIAAVLVWCVGTFALVTFMLYLLPRRREHMFLRRCTLGVVARYSEDKAWWLLVEMTTKILTCVTLSIFDSASSQLVWLGCVYITYLLLTTLAQPYRFIRHALFDMVLTFGKVLVLIFTVPLLEGGGGGNAFGTTCVTYVFYCLGALFLVWSWVDRFRGRACDIQKEQDLFEGILGAFSRVLPVQDSVEELVASAETLRISKRRCSASVGHSKSICSTEGTEETEVTEGTEDTEGSGQLESSSTGTPASDGRAIEADGWPEAVILSVAPEAPVAPVAAAVSSPASSSVDGLSLSVAQSVVVCV